ncbi:hypothetical protein Tco_0408065 [Tanacetum coccineum]
MTNQEQTKGKTKAHVYTDEGHYYEQKAEEQRLWKEEDERERRQQQKQRREEHWKEVRALIELEKKLIYEVEMSEQSYDSDDSNSNSYLRDILGDILGKDMYYPLTRFSYNIPPPSDDEESNHEDASDTGAAPKQQQQVIPQTTAILNIKLLILKKEEYDIWAMEMEHYLEYIDNEVWKVIQNGNSKKRISTGKDGIVRVLSPVTAAEIQVVKKESEGSHGAEVSTEDANHKFLRSLPAWSNLAMTMRTNPEIDTLSIDDLSFAGFADEVIYSLFAKQSEDWDLLHEDLEQIDDVDIEEMDINWQIAMIAIE